MSESPFILPLASMQSKQQEHSTHQPTVRLDSIPTADGFQDRAHATTLTAPYAATAGVACSSPPQLPCARWTAAHFLPRDQATILLSSPLHAFTRIHRLWRAAAMLSQFDFMRNMMVMPTVKMRLECPYNNCNLKKLIYQCHDLA